MAKSRCSIGPVSAGVAISLACALGACGGEPPASPPSGATATTAGAPVPAAAPPGAPPSAEPSVRAPAHERPAVVVAELVDRGPKMPDCGTLHVRVVMRYRAKRTLQGSLAAGSEVFVIVGCPELSRRAYGGEYAGDLDAFRNGEWHEMVLHHASPEELAQATDSFSAMAGPRFVPERIDRANGEGPPWDRSPATFKPVSGAGYQGVIVPSFYPVADLGKARFTPTADDIEAAEKLVAAQLPSMSGDEPGDVAFAAGHLPAYLRQYAGFIDGGERVIWANFFLTAHGDGWRDDILWVRGGGAGYFRIRVRLGKGRCEELDINSPK